MFKGITSAAKGYVIRAGFKLKKYSPEILMGVGIVGVVAGTVMACKATLRANDILDEHEKRLADIAKAKEIAAEGEYTPAEQRKDTAMAYAKTVGSLARLYAPTAVVEAIALACMFGSYRILKVRNLGLIAAYKAVDEAFKGYRERTRSRFGEAVEKELYHGLGTATVVEESTEEGAEPKVKEVVGDATLPDMPSQYARFFDEGSPNWTKDPALNLTFLTTQEQYFNDRLQIIGHVFLNEVYDYLGLPRSKAGAIVGWTKNGGDGYVDFGIFDAKKVKNRDFVNGYENVILLDFNVDGVIWDKI